MICFRGRTALFWVICAVQGMFRERPYRSAPAPGQNGLQSLQRRPYFAPKRVFKRSFDVFRRESRIRGRFARSRCRAAVATSTQQYSGPAARKNRWIPRGNTARAPETCVLTPGIAGVPLFSASGRLTKFSWAGVAGDKIALAPRNFVTRPAPPRKFGQGALGRIELAQGRPGPPAPPPPARNSKRSKMPPNWAPRSDFSIFGCLPGLGEKESSNPATRSPPGGVRNFFLTVLLLF